MPVFLFPICSASVGSLSLALPLSGVLFLFLLWLNRKVGLAMVLVLGLLAIKFLHDSPGAPGEWINSAILFTLNISILAGLGMIVFSKRANLISRERIEMFRNFIIAFLTLHAAFMILQFIMFNYMGNFALLNPLGAFSPPGPNPETSDLTPYNPLLQTIKRPNGLAWEPSVASVWELWGLALMLSHPERVRYRTLKMVLMILGIVAASSAIGYVVLSLVLLHYFYFSRQFNRTAMLIFYPIVLVAVIFFAPLFASLIGISDRLDEFSRIGSSGYIRFTAPLELIRERGFSLLGSEGLGMRTYREAVIFQALGNELAGIANMYFEIYIYFGLTGVVLYLFLIGRLAVQSFRDPPMFVLLVLFPIFGGYLFNTLALYPVFITLTVHGLYNCKFAEERRGWNLGRETQLAQEHWSDQPAPEANRT